MNFWGVLHETLLYVNSFAALFALFASAISIAVWTVITLVRWLTAEPASEAKKRDEMYLNADQLKRAGQ